jgi:O-antigen/teichoic acid export membrane protein
MGKNVTKRGLTAKISRAIKWNVLASLVTLATQVSITIVLARFLTPNDYGVFVIANTLLVIVGHLTTRGIVGAMVRRTSLNQKDIDTAVALSLMVAGAVIIIWLICTFIFSGIYQTPSSDYKIQIMQYLTISIAFQILSSPSQAVLQRELDFSRITIFQLFSILIGNGFVALSLAVAGYGAWSLANGMVVNSVLNFVFLIWATRKNMGVYWHRDRGRRLLYDSVSMGFLRTIDISWVQLPYLLLGSLGTIHQVGLFQRMHFISDLAQQTIAARISSVLFPVIATRRLGRPTIINHIKLMSSIYSVLALPIAAFTAVAAPSIIKVLLGENWLGEIGVMPILAVAFGIWTMNQPFSLVLEAKGWFSVRYLSAVSGILALVVISVLIPFEGILSVAIATLISSAVILAINSIALAHITRANYSLFIRTVIPGVLVSIGIAFTTGLSSKGMEWYFGIEIGMVVLTIQAFVATVTWVVLLKFLVNDIARSFFGSYLTYDQPAIILAFIKYIGTDQDN